MVPYLRQGDYGKAAEVAAWQLAKYIADDAGATLSGQPPAVRNQNGRGNVGFPIFWVFLGLIIFFRVIASLSRRGRGGPGRGGSRGSGCLWFLLGMLANSGGGGRSGDRKSTRLNSSHSQISYAVFCLKKKKQSPRIPCSPRLSPTGQPPLPIHAALPAPPP